MAIMNPNYSVPAGLDIPYDDDYVLNYSDQDESGDGDHDGGAGGDNLFPPTEINIISQDMHYADDGTLVVDLIGEVPDQDGVVKYDVRISKYEG